MLLWVFLIQYWKGFLGLLLGEVFARRVHGIQYLHMHAGTAHGWGTAYCVCPLGLDRSAKAISWVGPNIRTARARRPMRPLNDVSVEVQKLSVVSLPVTRAS